MLRARLYEVELQKREDAANAQAASKTDIGWVTRSVPTFCSLTSWSRICAPALKAPRPATCWTVI